MAHVIDDDDFDDFLAKVNEVDATIKGKSAARHGGHGVAWRGVEWRGMAWRGVAWHGMAWRGVVG
jgi:hypothetical protein